MLPPLPASRQASYNYTLPRRASSSRRIPSYAPSHQSRPHSQSHLHVTDLDANPNDNDEEEGDFETRLEMEEEIDGMNDERGLENTLESIGFGAYQWRLLALCGFGWMSDNSALQCIGLSSFLC